MRPPAELRSRQAIAVLRAWRIHRVIPRDQGKPMSITVEALIALRNRTLDEYVHGRTSEDAQRADLSAIAVELDRVVSPAGEGRLEDRAARVVAEILATSRARRADDPPESCSPRILDPTPP